MIGGVAAAAVDAFGVDVERRRRNRRTPAPVRCRRARPRRRRQCSAALPARSQSAGVLNSAPIIITTGSRGGGLLANQAGGRYTNSPRCLNFDAAALISLARRPPWRESHPASCIAVTVARSVWSGSGPAVS